LVATGRSRGRKKKDPTREGRAFRHYGRQSRGETSKKVLTRRLKLLLCLFLMRGILAMPGYFR
jgi:hypothetical protein